MWIFDSCHIVFWLGRCISNLLLWKSRCRTPPIGLTRTQVGENRAIFGVRKKWIACGIGLGLNEKWHPLGFRPNWGTWSWPGAHFSIRAAQSWFLRAPHNQISPTWILECVSALVVICNRHLFCKLNWFCNHHNHQLLNLCRLISSGYSNNLISILQ